MTLSAKGSRVVVILEKTGAILNSFEFKYVCTNLWIRSGEVKFVSIAKSEPYFWVD